VLQLEEMVWPGMGAEVVFELWERKPEAGGGLFVRTLFSGKVLQSASPALGSMNMLPLEKLLAYFDGLVGPRAGLIVDKCSGRIPLV
jgi:acid phosphatase